MRVDRGCMPPQTGIKIQIRYHPVLFELDNNNIFYGNSNLPPEKFTSYQQRTIYILLLNTYI